MAAPDPSAEPAPPAWSAPRLVVVEATDAAAALGVNSDGPEETVILS